MKIEEPKSKQTTFREFAWIIGEFLLIGAGLVVVFLILRIVASMITGWED